MTVRKAAGCVLGICAVLLMNISGLRQGVRMTLAGEGISIAVLGVEAFGVGGLGLEYLYLRQNTDKSGFGTLLILPGALKSLHVCIELAELRTLDAVLVCLTVRIFHHQLSSYGQSFGIHPLGVDSRTITFIIHTVSYAFVRVL